MYRSRHARTWVPVLGAFATSLVLLHACRDSDRPTAPPTPPAPPSGPVVPGAQASTTVIRPAGDTYLNTNSTNYAADTLLRLYTWPNDTIANVIVMKFDLTSLPAGSTISRATLSLYLSRSDASADPTYTVTAHKIVNKNPPVTRATGYTYDGVNPWTPNACCRNHVPLAQSDIGPPVDTRDVDKTVGFKEWDVTSIVQGWFSNPSTNFGLLLNSDPSKLRDRYRSFRSNQDPVTSRRPYLTVVTEPAAPGAPGTVADLAVEARSDHSVTLGFTEVDDGTGHAATYDVRFATPPIDWGSAAVVAQGTCTPPVAGTTIGAHKSCTVEGLSPGTTYDFQLVAYRGTPGQDAVFGGMSNVATATTATTAGPPGTVTDLAVVQVGSSSATLMFTEVDDGTGQAATYQMRYATSPIGWGWGSATVVTQGTCSAPLAGTAIGAQRRCTVDGLSSGTTYDFQMVAYRGAFDQAVFGQLSNVATGTTTSANQPLGQWSPLFPAPVVAVHLHLLPTGKVLSWGRDGDPQVWDPATGTFRGVPAPSWLFCAGHDFMSDGRLLVTGGHLDNDRGLPNGNVFDPATESWKTLPAMAQGRWYPTSTTLPNGEVLTVAGRDENQVNVEIPEIWNGSGWRRLTTAPLGLAYYAKMFVMADGRIFYAGEYGRSYYLNVTGTGSWTTGPLRTYGTRDYGSAVMYQPGKILYVGGGDPPTNTAEIIDLNQPNPTWTRTGSMAFARRQMNATLLPTGDVVVTGGTSGGGFNNPVGAVHAAELWHPATGTWTTLASNAVTRIYHSTTLLLPDGRVLHTGSGGGQGVDQLNYELYSPPYLFQGARPSITGTLPSGVGYGQTVFVETPNGAGITKVTFIRLSSVTHAFDMGARLVPLGFSQAPGGLAVAIPGSRTTAPPGPYMLFLVNGNGVPSVGRILLLR
jgi:hypothetical protein